MMHDSLVSLIRQSTRETFTMMLGVDVSDGGAYLGEPSPEPSEGVLALVGLAGRWAGSGTFSCSARMARKISGQLLMQEFESVDGEVLDAIGEVANIIFGNVKTSLEDSLGPMGLSIPTVIYGRNFTTRSVGRSEWSVVAFEAMGEKLEVQLCLAPSKDASPAHRHPAVLTIAG